MSTENDAPGAGMGAPARIDDDRPYLTLRAQAERAGFTLHMLSSGGFVLGRWGLARELPDLAAVAALLLRLGARS